ncbi:expressed unknown protein [Seminavis robusta]|uniref:Uncharacterized protein n=1 Tax=Seminavis robusta TaxID=568900 RepID=A0A9N8H2X9_9STRA|nr:expressed unknown protein [Seminavis robusta]|eukprot:Sro16_g011960.1 n/a (397) ;mRNA; r:174079-175269
MRTKRQQWLLPRVHVLLFVVLLLVTFPSVSVSLQRPQQQQQANARRNTPNIQPKQQRGNHIGTTATFSTNSNSNIRLCKLESQVMNLFQWTMVLLSWSHIKTTLAQRKMTIEPLCLLIASLCNLSYGMFRYLTTKRPSSSSSVITDNTTTTIKQWMRQWKRFELVHWCLTAYIVWCHYRHDIHLLTLGMSWFVSVWIRHELQIPRTLTTTKQQFSWTWPKRWYVVVVEYGAVYVPASMLLWGSVAAMQLHADDGRIGYCIALGIPLVANVLASIAVMVDLEDLRDAPSVLLFMTTQRLDRLVRILTGWWMLLGVSILSLVLSTGVQLQFPKGMLVWHRDTLTVARQDYHPPWAPLGILIWVCLPYWIRYCVKTFVREHDGTVALSQPTTKTTTNTF